MTHPFLKSYRLRKKKEFHAVRAVKKILIGSFVKIIFSKKNAHTKLGIAAPSYYGNAVVRNRFKRQIREAFRLTYPTLPLGLHMIIYPRKRAKTTTTAELMQELKQLLHRD